jgi:hypothetical protein
MKRCLTKAGVRVAPAFFAFKTRLVLGLVDRTELRCPFLPAFSSIGRYSVEDGAVRPIKVKLAQRKKSFYGLIFALPSALLSGKIG